MVPILFANLGPADCRRFCWYVLSEDKADKRRGGKTTLGNGQAWSLPSPRWQWKTGKMEEIGYKVICGAPATLAVKG